MDAARNVPSNLKSLNPRVTVLNFKKRLQASLLATGLTLALLPVTGVNLKAQSSHAQIKTQANEIFKFEKIDLDLLEQVELLDKRFEKEGLVYHEAVLEEYLSRVGKAVTPDKQMEKVEWRFHALRDPTPNAFALPNGSIYINTGLLALLDDEGQLASVFAHEVTHVLKRHTYAQNRSIRKKVLAINILSTIATWNPIGGGAGMAIDVIANVSPLILGLSVFGYSRELEKEADLEGLKSLTGGGYAPQEMVNTFKLLQKDIEGEQLNSFYSDHPKLEDRVTYVSNSIDVKARPISDEELRPARAQFIFQMEAVDRHDVELAISAGRFRSAQFVSQKLVDFHPDSSENVFYLAESYRSLGPRTPEIAPSELTTGAKKQSVKTRSKLTLEEQETKLMATAEGQRAWKTNQEKAEQLYFRALELNRLNSVAHRGLGMLYEKVEKKEAAADQYGKYLEFAPKAADSARFRRRVGILRGVTSDDGNPQRVLPENR